MHDKCNDKCKKTEHLKNLTISYDMTSDEGILVGENVKEAKEKNRK